MFFSMSQGNRNFFEEDEEENSEENSEKDKNTKKAFEGRGYSVGKF